MALGRAAREGASDTHVARPGTRVVVPYTERARREVFWALQEARVEYDAVDVSGSDDAYWRLLSDLWADGESFTIVEHDVLVSRQVLDSFDACDRPWCVAKYPYLRGTYWGLGCTRFDESVLREWPDLIEEAGAHFDESHLPRHWCTLDVAILRAMRRRRYDWPHVHGTVDHLGSQLPAHGCRP